MLHFRREARDGASASRALDGLVDEALMLADGVSLASVFDKLKSADGQGRGNGRIDFDRPCLHEQRSIIRCVALDVPAGDLKLARVFKFLHSTS
jgi:hypothetical protein